MRNTLVLLTMLVLLVGCQASTESYIPKPATFELATIVGLGSTTVGEYLATLDKPCSALTYWQVGCSGCRKQLMEWDAAIAAPIFQDAGIAIVNVNVGHTFPETAQEMKEFPALVFASGITQEESGVRYIPMTVVYNRASEVVGLWVGPGSANQLMTICIEEVGSG